MPVFKSILCHCVDGKIAVEQAERGEPQRLCFAARAQHIAPLAQVRGVGMPEPGVAVYLSLLTLLKVDLKSKKKILISESLEDSILIFFFF